MDNVWKHLALRYRHRKEKCMGKETDKIGLTGLTIEDWRNEDGNLPEIDKYKIPPKGMPPRVSYRIIHDELELNSKPSLNLGTFVTTRMDDEARRLAMESIDVNLVDHSFYPATTEIQKRIVNMAADMLNRKPSSKKEDYVGTATVGSSEAVMLGILAHKTKWLEWYDQLPDDKKPKGGRRPNLVIGGAYQVCWEKAYKFFDIAGIDGYKSTNGSSVEELPYDDHQYDPVISDREPVGNGCRIIPLERGRNVVTAHTIKTCIMKGIIDENTCAIGLALGTTLTGEMDEINEINDIIKEYNEKRAEDTSNKSYPIPIHVDGAYGGFILPFTEPYDQKIRETEAKKTDEEKERVWDFRLSEVKSINISNHKYGMVYPGLGTVIFSKKSDVPESLFTDVNYLGGTIHDYALNFSRASWQVVCQYYNFLRFGREGYTRIMDQNLKVASHVANHLVTKWSKYFELLTAHKKDANHTGKVQLRLPNLVVRLKKREGLKAVDLSNRLRQDGWTVPAYTLPKNRVDDWVLRIVVKESFTMDMANLLIQSIDRAMIELIKSGSDEFQLNQQKNPGPDSRC